MEDLVKRHRIIEEKLNRILHVHCKDGRIDGRPGQSFDQWKARLDRFGEHGWGFVESAMPIPEGEKK